MIFDFITIFPEMISGYTKIGIIARAIKKKIIRIQAHDLRDFSEDSHHTVDGRPYGGGFGMVLKSDVLYKAIKKITGLKRGSTRVILLTPQGKIFRQAHAKRLAKYKKLVFVCGRYEGFDERVRYFVDEEFSIGDYILMGGELPALVMAEAVSRYVPGVVGKKGSIEMETFAQGILEYPQYTRPEIFKAGKKKLLVPKILLSGDHGKIAAWRAEQAYKRTKKRRPDLLNPQDYTEKNK